MNRYTIYNENVLTGLQKIADKSVQCIVTSPPYWGLRSYKTVPQVWGGEKGCKHEWGETVVTNGISGGTNQGGKVDNAGGPTYRPVEKGKSNFCVKCGAWKGEYGNEPTMEMYVEHTAEIFRECKRVLRDDGTLWLNLGDSYGGLKQKDLCGIPWRVAFALQADGWYLRSDIIWAKPNPMPESCVDRPTKGHEYVFLFTKRARYFYDADAIKEPLSESTLKEIEEGYNGTEIKDYSGTGAQKPSETKKRIIKNLRERKQFIENESGSSKDIIGHKGLCKANGEPLFNTLGRNRRTVWEITSKPYAGSHFTTFPPELPEICIKAGSSQVGACEECGAPMERVKQKLKSFESGSGRSGNRIAGKNGEKLQGGGDTGDIRKGPTIISNTIGWRRTCKCETERVKPCVVMDPFLGSGTTGEVALRLGRNFVGIELNEKYVKELARPRLEKVMPLFSNATEEEQ